MSKDKDPLDDMADDYENLVEPKNWIKIFPTMESFRKWVVLGTIEDIESTIKEFEQEELYEHCAIMMDVLKERKKRFSQIMNKVKNQK
jgi:hypothetical protein